MSRPASNFTHRGAQLRAASLKWSRRTRAEFLARGLTSRGTVRQQERHEDLRGLPFNEYRRQLAARRRVRLRARGLTSRNTLPVARYTSYPELDGLPPRDRELQRMRLWYYRRSAAQQRAAVAALLNHRSHAALALQLKSTGRRRVSK